MTQPNTAFTPSTNTAPSTAKSVSNPLKTTQDSLSKHDINALANSMNLFTEKLYGKHQPTQLSASFVPYTTSSQSTRTQSNHSPTRKGTENPVSKDKKPGLTISVDNTDLKDILKNYKKVFPQTTKASKTPYSVGLQDKAKKGTDSKAKKLSQGDDNLRKKSPTNRETSKGKIELKQKIIMEEPHKKSSLPQNLALSLNSLYTVGDSNSHRAVVSSRVGENNTTKTVVAANSVKANRKQLSTEGSQQVQEKPKSFSSGLLANLESMSARNVSKISINNINNVGTINNCYIQDTNAASVKAGANHADFETALKEKDEEIHKLIKDKQELQGVLELLVYEINDRKQGKIGSKEKDEAIGGLMVSLIEALGGTEENKESVIESPGRQVASKRRSQKGNVSQDMENVRTIVNQLKTVSSSPDRSDKVEYRNELLETLMQNNAREMKKSNEGKAYDLYQRSFSTAGDTTVNKKKESPYCEPLKPPTSKKGGKNGTVSSRTKNSLVGNGDTGNRKSMTGKEGMNNTSKGKFYIETLKTQEIDNGLIKTLPSTTTNAGSGGHDMLKRKFSHDPKMVSEVISDLLAKKQSVATVESVERRVEKKNGGERLDIRSALDGLKERIAKALGSQRRLQDKLKDAAKVE